MEKNDYINLVAHEVKTPIAIISGYSDIIRNGKADKEAVCRYAGNIYKESNRMAKLVDDMVYILKAFEGELVPRLCDKDITEIFFNAIEKIKIQYRDLGEIKFVINGNAKVMADEFMLETAIYKILENCVLFGNNKYKNDSLLPYVNINVSISQNNEKTGIEISDTGKGMSKEANERAFELFYREDKKAARDMGCNGLGLAVAKVIVEAHGGECKINSVTDEGTTVTITI